MRLVRLRIGRLPGIGSGFEIEGFAPGLNVVHGPNASGKSSLCRSVRAVLYEEAVDGAIDLEAEFEETGTGARLRVQRQGRDIHWTRDGQKVEPPLLPDERWVSCFTIHLEDLLSRGDTEKIIDERITKILAGGYDVEAVRTELRVPGTTGRNEAKLLESAEKTLNDVRRDQREIRKAEGRLDELREQQRESERAAGRVAVIDRALDLLEARWSLRESALALEGYPKGMAGLRGGEEERLETLSEKRANAKTAREKAERTLEDAKRELRGSRLAESDLDAPALGERQTLLEQLKDAERKLEDAQRVRADADQSLRSALGELGGSKPPADVRIEPDSVRRTENLLGRKRALGTRIEVLEERRRLLDANGSKDANGARGSGGADHSSKLNDARNALSLWLKSPAPDAAFPSADLRVRTGLVLLVVGGLAGICIAGWKVNAAFLLLAPAVLIGAALLRRRRTGARESDPGRRPQAERDMAESGMAGPERWDDDSVGSRLRAIEAEIATSARAAADAGRRTELTGELDHLRGELAPIEDDLRHLADETGFDGDALGASFDRWLRLVGAYDEARHSRDRSDARLEKLTRRVQGLRDGLHAFLTEHGEPPSVDDAGAAVLEVRMSSLVKRLAQRETAENDHERAAGDIVREEKNIAETSDEIAEVFRHAGIESEDRAELGRRLSRLENWKRDERVHVGSETLARKSAERLGEDAELMALVEAGDRGVLEQLQGEQKACAEQLEERSKAVGAIDDRIERARRGSDLADASSALSQATEELRAALDSDLRSAAVGFLLDDVQRVHERDNRPAVLDKAARWLARFTNREFTLRAGGAGAAGMHARDETLDEGRTLEQLSSGTRAQLLLALRLAFALDAERGRESLPFFLDEALATTDPWRYRDIVRCVDAFAREDVRQVVYLTAQPADVAPWRDAVAPPPRLIDISAVRGRGLQRGEPPAYPLEPLPEVPAPESEDAEAYARVLGVAAMQLWDPVASAHVLHLSRDDLERVHRLVRAGFTHVGPLRSLLAEDSRAIASPQERTELRWRIEGLEILTQALREGRGRPVDRHVLSDSGAISDKYLDRLDQLAEELDGDAALLVQALRDKSDRRTSGFYRDKCDDLEEYLESEGFLDRRARLDSAAIYSRLLSGLRHHVAAGSLSDERLRAWHQSVAGAANAPVP